MVFGSTSMLALTWGAQGGVISEKWWCFIRGLVVLYPRNGGVLSEDWWCYIRVLVVLYPRNGGVLSETTSGMEAVQGAKKPVK